MAETLINAIGDLMRLQRWNAMPRIETWSEAENIAYTTHIAYAVGKLRSFSDDQIVHVMTRALLKSLNKHYLSDILVDTREEIRKLQPNVWEKLVNQAANATAILFPRKISNFVWDYMTFRGDYKDDIKEAIEELIKFAQYKVAIRECEINMPVYEDFYKPYIERISKKIEELKFCTVFEECYSKLQEYQKRVENLKNLRRWNRVNRSVETSVLGHIFIVALLALIISKSSEEELQQKGVSQPLYSAILIALFHDVPETFTGDIIAPVKDIINRESENLLKEVQTIMLNGFKDAMPLQVQGDMEKYKLLEELDDSTPYTISSLVKACDRLSIVLECIFEMEMGRTSMEMTSAYNSYISRLQNSEWASIRELCTHVLFEHPKASKRF
jgi:putative hydrolases of HD superfamily